MCISKALAIQDVAQGGSCYGGVSQICSHKSYAERTLLAVASIRLRCVETAQAPRSAFHRLESTDGVLISAARLRLCPHCSRLSRWRTAFVRVIYRGSDPEVSLRSLAIAKDKRHRHVRCLCSVSQHVTSMLMLIGVYPGQHLNDGGCLFYHPFVCTSTQNVLLFDPQKALNGNFQSVTLNCGAKTSKSFFCS